MKLYDQFFLFKSQIPSALYLYWIKVCLLQFVVAAFNWSGLRVCCVLDGSRVVQMDDSFFTGYRKTIVRPQEVLVSIEIPHSRKVNKPSSFYCYSFLQQYSSSLHVILLFFPSLLLLVHLLLSVLLVYSSFLFHPTLCPVPLFVFLIILYSLSSILFIPPPLLSLFLLSSFLLFLLPLFIFFLLLSNSPLSFPDSFPCPLPPLLSFFLLFCFLLPSFTSPSPFFFLFVTLLSFPIARPHLHTPSCIFLPSSESVCLSLQAVSAARGRHKHRYGSNERDLCPRHWLGGGAESWLRRYGSNNCASEEDGWQAARKVSGTYLQHQEQEVDEGRTLTPSDVTRCWGEELLQEACSSLASEMTLDPSAPGGMVTYRRTLTLSLFYKFYLTVLQKLQRQVGEKIITTIIIIISLRTKINEYIIFLILSGVLFTCSFCLSPGCNGEWSETRLSQCHWALPPADAL